MPKALLVVDVLDGIFTLPVPTYAADAFLAGVSELVSSARKAAAVVVHVQHFGPPGTLFAKDAPGRRIHSSVAPRANELVIDKEHPDSFQGTTLEAELRSRGVRDLVVCGFATQHCVDTTVRSAYAHGFSVELAADAHTTTSNEVLDAATIIAHHNRVLARFAQVKPRSAISFS